MKTTPIIAAILPAIMVGCSSAPQNTDIATIDISGKLPEKEIFIEDIADVTFTPLETTDTFITRGNVTSINDKYIAVANNGRDGEIFIFDRDSGRAVSHINRMGQGAGEYTSFSKAVLSNHADEIFVVCDGLKKIMVYDIQGNFIRELPFSHPDDKYIRISSLADYDAEHLLAFFIIGTPRSDTSESYHALISKADGTVAHTFPITITQPESSVYSKDDFVAVSILPTIGSTDREWAFSRVSSDTIFALTSDLTLRPLFVRKPSVHTSDPQTFIYPTSGTPEFTFLLGIEKSFDMEKMTGFPSTHIVYDKTARQAYQCLLRSRNLGPEFEFTTAPGQFLIPGPGIIAAIPLSTETLRGLADKEQLSPSLTELLNTMDDEDNPIILIATNR